METSREHLDQLATLAKAKGFLGREFLTWLWYTAETSKERLKIAGCDLEVDLWVDDRLVLEGTAAMSHQNVMKGGDPSHSREAAMSLITGKTVRELKLGCGIKGIGEYSAVLNCDDLNPRALKLPSPDQDAEPVDADALPVARRLSAVASFLQVLDGLFLRFLTLRVSPDWEKVELGAIRDWIKQRQSKLESKTLH